MHTAHLIASAYFPSFHLYRDRKYSNQNEVTAPASATLGTRTHPLLSIMSEDLSASSISREMVAEVKQLLSLLLVTVWPHTQHGFS